MAKKTKKTSKFVMGFMKALAAKKGLDVEQFLSDSDSD
jgi:hypothetical protein